MVVSRTYTFCNTRGVEQSAVMKCPLSEPIRAALGIVSLAQFRERYAHLYTRYVT
jgi:hypothetical protein